MPCSGEAGEIPASRLSSRSTSSDLDDPKICAIDLIPRLSHDYVFDRAALVPRPIACRIRRPRLKAPAWTMSRLRMF